MTEGLSPTHRRLEGGRLEAAVRVALRDGLVGTERALLFHDLDLLRDRIHGLRAVFPADTLHALAIKANPLVSILEVAVAAGAGLEAASMEEVELALAAGCEPGRILFDSPAKTMLELRQAVAGGISINADHFDELERIAALAPQSFPSRTMGLRINPEVGEGAIAATSVAGVRSRFGVPLSGSRGRLEAVYRRYPWLNALHVHVGSQGCALELLVEGAARATELALHLNALLGHNQITTLDIGGGLSWAYRGGAAAPTPKEYLSALATRIPSLLRPPFRIVTEFGRSVQAGCGVALSRVETVKQVAGIPVAVLHVGADLLLRRVYQPHIWHHAFLVLDSSGALKQGPLAPHSLAGPLCFSGDILASEVLLPPISPGDFVAILDAGAYTLSMWSRHCSRGMPAVYGMEGDDQDLRLSLLRREETAADIVRFWSTT